MHAQVSTQDAPSGCFFETTTQGEIRQLLTGSDEAPLELALCGELALGTFLVLTTLHRHCQHSNHTVLGIQLTLHYHMTWDKQASTETQLQHVGKQMSVADNEAGRQLYLTVSNHFFDCFGFNRAIR